MSYYWFNRQELLQKAKEKYDNGGKEKATKYYQANKDFIKEKAKGKYKNLSDKKEAKKAIFQEQTQQNERKITCNYKNELLLVQYRKVIEKCMG